MRTRIENDAWWPTAIFAANDRVGLGAIQALLESGRRVPDDISLLGYDDQPSLAAQVHPALTTITLPHLEMGQLAVNALLGQIEPGLTSGALVAHPQLIVRDSVRNIGPPIAVPDEPFKTAPPVNITPPLRKRRRTGSRAAGAGQEP
jgi:DNA-binding LacI/PurR family transcriptional regulator